MNIFGIGAVKHVWTMMIYLVPLFEFHLAIMNILKPFVIRMDLIQNVPPAVPSRNQLGILPQLTVVEIHVGCFISS